MSTQAARVRILVIDDSLMVYGQHLMIRDICQRLDKTRFEVLAAYLESDVIRDSYQTAGVRCISIGSAGSFKRLKNFPKNLWCLVRLVSLIRKERVDVIQTNGMISHLLGSLAVVLTRVRQVRIPGSFMTTTEPLHAKLFPLFRLDRFTRAYVCGLPGVKRELVSRGVPEAKLKTVIFGVDNHRFYPDGNTSATRHELGAEEGDTLIGVASRLAEDRGHEPLMRVVSRLIQNGRTGLKVAFVGDGLKRREFEDLSHELGLDQKVVFTGSRNDMPQVINAFDIAVLASKGAVGGSFLREAMACGKPIVSPDGPSGVQHEWITHRENGLLVEASDIEGSLYEALIYLLDNPDIAHRIGRNARAYVEQNMTMEKSIGELEQVFVDVYS